MPRSEAARDPVRARASAVPFEPVSNDALRAVRDQRLDNKSFQGLVDAGPVNWDANRRFSLDSKAVLEAVSKSQAAGASDRDLAWGRDTLWRADRIWAERHSGLRVEDSAPLPEPVLWQGAGTGFMDYATEVGRNELQKQQLAMYWGRRS